MAAGSLGGLQVRHKAEVPNCSGVSLEALRVLVLSLLVRLSPEGAVSSGLPLSLFTWVLLEGNVYVVI